MEPITVYRIEFETGDGLHRARNAQGEFVLDSHSCKWDICERHNDKKLFPNFHLDKHLFNSISILRGERINHYHFAFNDLHTLRLALLDHEIKECNELGFRILELTVTDYVQSPYQTIFKKKSVINRTDITKQFL